MLSNMFSHVCNPFVYTDFHFTQCCHRILHGALSGLKRVKSLPKTHLLVAEPNLILMKILSSFKFCWLNYKKCEVIEGNELLFRNSKIKIYLKIIYFLFYVQFGF